MHLDAGDSPANDDPASRRVSTIANAGRHAPIESECRLRFPHCDLVADHRANGDDTVNNFNIIALAECSPSDERTQAAFARKVGGSLVSAYPHKVKCGPYAPGTEYEPPVRKSSHVGSLPLTQGEALARMERQSKMR